MLFNYQENFPKHFELGFSLWPRELILMVWGLSRMATIVALGGKERELVLSRGKGLTTIRHSQTGRWEGKDSTSIDHPFKSNPGSYQPPATRKTQSTGRADTIRFPPSTRKPGQQRQERGGAEA
jgi:hypothetical protein